jgi:hypothetical protein
MKIDDILLKKAAFWAKILGHLPGVRAIFLSGSLASGKARKTSDIDFLIIARFGQIWTARFFIFIILKTFHQLAKPHHHAGRICPNHFITDHSLEIEEKDAYAAQLFCHNVPLYDPLNLWNNFVDENEDWIKSFEEVFHEIPGKTFGPPCKKSFIHHSIWETFFRWIQRAKIMKNSDFNKPGAKIILTNKELRFHPKPKNKYWKK